MIPVADYHMHTPLCGHAVDEPQQYAQHAIAVGLKEIGFSDHAPFLKHPLPGITMEKAELPKYHRMIEDVARNFSRRLSVKVAIEADYLPGYEEQTRALLAAYPYDYVYGSVHFIDEWAFDNPEERARWNDEDVNQVYERYYDLLAGAAQSGLFDIMAHVDLVKKFGNRPEKDMTARVRQTACIFKSAGVAIEINTSGLRKEVKEIYPSLDVLRIYAQEGVDLVFGSDAHTSQQVGMNFEEAYALAKKAGYRDYVLFKGRKIQDRIPLV